MRPMTRVKRAHERRAGDSIQRLMRWGPALLLLLFLPLLGACGTAGESGAAVSVDGQERDAASESALRQRLWLTQNDR